MNDVVVKVLVQGWTEGFEEMLHDEVYTALQSRVAAVRWQEVGGRKGERACHKIDAAQCLNALIM